MNRLFWIELVLLATLTTAVIVQGRWLADLQREQAVLQAARQEAQQLAAANRALANLRISGDELDVLRQANRDLPRLRNEIRQWRERRQEMEKLQAQNARLAEQIKTGVVAPKSISDMEGYVAKENWVSAGFATPEAAVQSFFWAMNARNITALADCVAPSERDQLLKQYQRMTEEQRQHVMDNDNIWATMKGFRIAEKKTESEDKVILGIQAAADGELLPIPVRRYGAEWKIEDLSHH